MIPVNLRIEFLKNPIGMDVITPRFSWEIKLSDKAVEKGITTQKGYHINILHNGSLFWDSGQKNDNAMNNIYYSGPKFQSFNKYTWKVRLQSEAGEWGNWSESSYFVTGALTSENLKGKWILDKEREMISVEAINTTKKEPQIIFKSNPSPLLRKQIQCKDKIKSAFAIISALGYYEATINGKKIGDSFLTPEWTNYYKRILYQMYDVTYMLSEGKNVIGAMLGDGWFMSLLGPGSKPIQHFFGNRRAFYFQLIVEYENGQKESFCTDSSWKIYPDGPIRSADNFLGETYDAHFKIDNWNIIPPAGSPDFDLSKWESVEESKENNELIKRMRAQMHVGIKTIDVFRPKSITKHKNGTYILDFGQNLVGVCKFEWEGKDGDAITIRHGEMLEEDGSLHTENLRLATQKDVFIHNGKGKQKFQPRFTFHGFQYIEVSGQCESILDSITAIAISSVTEQTGTFMSSSSLLNQIWQNAFWTQRDNMVSIPTDCPQRDERMGWMGDALVFAQTGIFNSNLAAFFRKFNYDIIDGQKDNGAIPDFVPHSYYDNVHTDAPGWADCCAEIPWRCYINYGDRKIIEESLPTIKKHLDRVIRLNPDLIWSKCGNKYGDWLNGDNLKVKGYPKSGGRVPFEFFSTMNLLRTVRLYVKMNQITGNEAEAKQYTLLVEQIREKIIKKFVKKNAKIERETQAGYALAVDWKLFGPESYDKVWNNLKKAFKRYKGRLSTGFFSTRSLLNTLRILGQADLAYQLIHSTQFPSWGYSIEQGATTIWERWDGYVKGRGFQSRGMNSFNHYAYGSVVEFFYTTIFGINPDPENPGYANIIFEPVFDPTLSSVEGSYHSIRGLIKVKWEKFNLENQKTKYRYNFSIPPNTTGTLKLKLLNGKIELWDSRNRNIHVNEGQKEVKLKTGSYLMEFTK